MSRESGFAGDTLIVERDIKRGELVAQIESVGSMVLNVSSRFELSDRRVGEDINEWRTRQKFICRLRSKLRIRKGFEKRLNSFQQFESALDDGYMKYYEGDFLAARNTADMLLNRVSTKPNKDEDPYQYKDYVNALKLKHLSGYDCSKEIYQGDYLFSDGRNEYWQALAKAGFSDTVLDYGFKNKNTDLRYAIARGLAINGDIRAWNLAFGYEYGVEKDKSEDVEKKQKNQDEKQEVVKAFLDAGREEFVFDLIRKGESLEFLYPFSGRGKDKDVVNFLESYETDNPDILEHLNRAWRGSRIKKVDGRVEDVYEYEMVDKVINVARRFSGSYPLSCLIVDMAEDSSANGDISSYEKIREFVKNKIEKDESKDENSQRLWKLTLIDLDMNRLKNVVGEDSNIQRDKVLVDEIMSLYISEPNVAAKCLEMIGKIRVKNYDSSVDMEFGKKMDETVRQIIQESYLGEKASDHLMSCMGYARSGIRLGDDGFRVSLQHQMIGLGNYGMEEDVLRLVKGGQYDSVLKHKNMVAYYSNWFKTGRITRSCFDQVLNSGKVYKISEFLYCGFENGYVAEEKYYRQSLHDLKDDFLLQAAIKLGIDDLVDEDKKIELMQKIPYSDYLTIESQNKIDSLTKLIQTTEPGDLDKFDFSEVKFKFGIDMFKNGFFDNQVEKILERSGIPRAIFFKRWWWGGGERNNDILTTNFHRFISMEINSPGITKFLFDNYGIACLSRYPIEYLEMMKDCDGDKEQKSVMVLGSAYDWNGGFSGPGQQEMYRRFYENDLKERGYMLRFYEIDNINYLKTAINNEMTKYGEIGPRLWTGHGSRWRLELGEDVVDPVSFLVILNELGIDQSKYPEAYMSCSLGGRFGMLQAVSSLTNYEMVGSHVVGKMANLGLEFDIDGNPVRFKVQYSQSSKKGVAISHEGRRYRRGRRVK